MRERRKQEAGVSKAKHRETRSASEKAKKLRDYKTRKQKEYRANMSGSKRRAIRSKDAKYRAEKREKEREERQKAKEKKELRAQQARVPVSEKIENMIESASPKTRKGLQQKHIYKSRARSSIISAFQNVTKSHKKAVVESLRQNQPPNKSAVARAIKLRRATLSYKTKGRKNVNRKIWREDRKAIEDFYYSPEVSVAMPNKRRSGTDLPLHIMQCSLIAAYQVFKRKYPNVNAGLSTFIRAKPVNVRLLRQMKWLQCVCDVCANVKYLLSSIRSSHSKNSFPIPGWLSQTPIECGLETICNGQEKFSSQCLERRCAKCGISVLMDELNDWGSDNPSDVICWKEWGKVKEQLADREVTRMKLQDKSGTRVQVVAALKGKLQKYGKHCFNARWQQAQHRASLDQVGEDEVVAVIDFSENFGISQQAEAQSAYYSHNQVTIHPCVCVYKLNENMVRDSVVFISNDLKHDAAAVSVFINQLVEHLQLQLPNLKKLTIWSDGCGSQYKSKQPFINLAGSFGHPDVAMEWNFFGCRHGKNASDGETGVIKTAMARLILSSQITIDNAKEFHQAAAQHLTKLDGFSLRHLYFVPSDDIKSARASQRKPKTVKGTMSIHSIVVNSGSGSISIKSASCFCVHCRNNGRCLYGTLKRKEVVLIRGLWCCCDVVAYLLYRSTFASVLVHPIPQPKSHCKTSN